MALGPPNGTTSGAVADLSLDGRSRRNVAIGADGAAVLPRRGYHDWEEKSDRRPNELFADLFEDELRLQELRLQELSF